MRHLLIEVDGGTVHVLVALLEGELHGHLDLAGLREPGAEAEDGDVDPVVEGEGGADVHVARPGCRLHWAQQTGAVSFISMWQVSLIILSYEQLLM